jgi:type I restriction enzyme R subunit
MQQALADAEIMDIPFVYTSKGDAFLEHDRTGTAAQVEREFALHISSSSASTSCY